METLKLHSYQEDIVKHICDTGRCNVWARMGMGKTTATLEAISRWQVLEGGKTLVLAPLRVALNNWPEEAAKFENFKNLKVNLLYGKDRGIKLEEDADVYVTNYESIPWLVKEKYRDWPFDTVIADESTRLKGFRLNKGTKRSTAIASILPKTQRWVNLTGTPNANGDIGLWGQQYFVDQGQRLGRTFTDFKDRWFKNHPNGFGLIQLPHAHEEIHAAIADTVATFDPRDYFDIKDPITTVVEVTLPKKARDMYNTLHKDFILALENGKIIEAFNSGGKLAKCLQAANGFVYDENRKGFLIHEEKLAALEEIIADAGGNPVLVAYQHKYELDMLKRHFKDAVELNKDPKTVERWNKGKIPILLAHPKSAGHGLNLQHGGNIIVFFAHWWDLEEHEQIIERIGPMRQMQSGYERPVYVYHIVAKGTEEDRVVRALREKRKYQDMVFSQNSFQ